ncbi:filamentous growth regulator 27 [Diplogelasinospora grovesii]|uniref:Filamentous growth regulator 27 n=1 Tax=Diplogelasinospora grovesii TaxID=303347 RepID=A0AAN6N8R4_9PEZI|nr:filamentous growth regulator 27 [Diplogelasinospora grovesii]
MERHHQPRARITNACDLCKLRKIKCSGATPCSYCVKRQQPETCHYSPQRQRRPRTRSGSLTQNSPAGQPHHNLITPAPSFVSSSISGPSPLTGITQETATPDQDGTVRVQDAQTPEELAEHEETEVPREARLLCDTQGKLIFIGDCAPLSFFQTVRRLVTSCVDAHAFAPQTSGYSALENVSSNPSTFNGSGSKPPAIESGIIESAVSEYLRVTSGFIDLFDDNVPLAHDISVWTAGAGQGRPPHSPEDATLAVNYLILAIGCHRSDEETAHAYFDYARDYAFTNLSGNLGVGTVQAFILVTLYMLGACQINGAFLFFGLAVRAAHSIGLHRTEVNARFGTQAHRQRDRLWRSLRVVDLFLSTSMGRPPATSDDDCTVSYRATEEDGQESFDLLNASVQVFLIIERIVLEVYSRRKISPQLTEGISRELRDWSTRWLSRLKEAVGATPCNERVGTVHGACQVLSSYYYAVILVSRPFLMYELHRRLSDEPSSTASSRSGIVTGHTKLADACIDAASLMVDGVQDLISRGLMTRRAPGIVPWLFASSLVLGLGLLGGFGRIIEKYGRSSIAALEFFAEADAHAKQYSLIAKALLASALEYVEKRELQERLQRTERSSLLFGLVANQDHGSNDNYKRRTLGNQQDASLFGGSDTKERNENLADNEHLAQPEGASPRFSLDFDSEFLGFTESLPDAPNFPTLHGHDDAGAEQDFGALNLFALLETAGHIDLANHL